MNDDWVNKKARRNNTLGYIFILFIIAFTLFALYMR